MRTDELMSALNEEHKIDIDGNVTWMFINLCRFLRPPLLNVVTRKWFMSSRSVDHTASNFSSLSTPFNCFLNRTLRIERENACRLR